MVSPWCGFDDGAPIKKVLHHLAGARGIAQDNVGKTKPGERDHEGCRGKYRDHLPVGGRPHGAGQQHDGAGLCGGAQHHPAKQCPAVLRQPAWPPLENGRAQIAQLRHVKVSLTTARKQFGRGVDLLDTEGRRAPADAMDFVALGQQELRQIGAVLAGDAGDEDFSCFARGDRLL